MCAVDVSRKLLTATRRMFPTLLEKRESVAGQPKASSNVVPSRAF